ncbi:carbohydrate porin [Rhodoplanes sp. TEM]|uniref:Carbohydrate porin n=1 Tax=Rhodoplanes tepidamans TaxID=200616 RepID=A0ABT5J857_RHOTP|nr:MULTISPECIES: carbohydrate porin [Rhodoplanes]MDC7785835.1 carbohydrate porin [Rhodoplanes tepidamans]MDC7986623.1 carbohydrate porin [Rhodoplanes sp. TEM]
MRLWESIAGRLGCRRPAARQGAAAGLVLITTAAVATAAAATAAAAQEGPTPGGWTAPSIATSLPANGDPTGARAWLAARGLTFNLIYTNDLLSNIKGGLRTGTVDQGKLELQVSYDFEPLTGWKGLTFYTDAYQIHDTGRFRRDYVGGVNTIAAIEAMPTTRLAELWLQQSFLGETASLRVGQLAADVEFFYSSLSFMFLQSDWPTITALNQPSGGPAYPLATPGIRLKVDPHEDLSVLVAVFNGDPAGPPPPADEQIRNRYGVNFRVQDPPLIIGEAQLRRNHGRDDAGLAAGLKLGVWSHMGEFDDWRLAADGTLLADPNGSGIALRHRGNWGVYAVVEQQLYRPKGGTWDSGVSLFGRVSASPSDRNPVDFYVDGGIVFAGLVPGRPDDKFGASAIYTRFSDALRAYDRDAIALGGGTGVVRDFEANLELNYTAQIVPGWLVQPVLTRVWHAAGDPRRNALVTGLRSMWQF